MTGSYSYSAHVYTIGQRQSMNQREGWCLGAAAYAVQAIHMV
jgi:hypothetical protein